MRIDGRQVLSFCSNDYLGLANHPRVIQALQDGARDWGVGSGASHLINGHCRAHHELEEALAAFMQCDRALLFSTGYMANLGVIAALVGVGDAVFEDRLNHASLVDGGRLSGARLYRYRHGDVSHLARRVNRAEGGTQLIVTDGVFSMDGDLAPLSELVRIARETQAWLMVDDAHGFGVLGEGRGVVAHLGLDPADVPIRVGTLGKALGTFGAFVAGPAELIELLLQTARTYRYTTALPPAIAAATLASLRLVEQDTWRRDHLKGLIRRFTEGARELGLTLLPSETPIQPLIVGHTAAALAASQALWDRGILVPAIRPPTVPEGTARLRITLSAVHTEAQVDRVLDALAQIRPGVV